MNERADHESDGSGSWTTVGRAQDLPSGSRQLIELKDRRVALFCDAGNYHAIDNHCPHRGGPLAAGALENGCLTCPWHGLAVELASGAVVPQTGGDLVKPGTHVVTYPVRCRDGNIEIRMTPTAATESDDGIRRYWVRYGALGAVGLFGTVHNLEYARGQAVFVATHRGTELGEVLREAVRTVEKTSGVVRPEGELLGHCAADDLARHAARGSLGDRLLAEIRELIEASDLALEVVDVEQTWDASCVVAYHLGPPTAELGPLAVQAATRLDVPRVLFQSATIGDDGPTPVPDGQILVEAVPTGPPQSHVAQERWKWSHDERLRVVSQSLDAQQKLHRGDRFGLQLHGVYQQRLRDPRVGKASHQFMVRLRTSAGRMTARQMLDTIAIGRRYGLGSLRITSRQGLQLHGVLPSAVRPAISAIHDSLMSTWSACGDVPRNVVCCPLPQMLDRARRQMQRMASELARFLVPPSEPYFRLWLDGEPLVEPSGISNQATRYGPELLPHKFKVGLAMPDDNCVDIWSQDVGLLAVVIDGQLIGFDLFVGGGQGRGAAPDDSPARLADPIGFVPTSEVLPVVSAVVGVYRDHGCRTERRTARLRHLLEQWGAVRFQAELELFRGGGKLSACRAPAITGSGDHLGWHAQGDGRFCYGLAVPAGRLRDESSATHAHAGAQWLAFLEQVCGDYAPAVRLTPGQNLLLCDITPQNRQAVNDALRTHQVAGYQEQPLFVRQAMACPALPTCGLAITDAERQLPKLLAQLKGQLAELGLLDQSLCLRMTGCGNGCARPYTAEIGIIGTAADNYTIRVGGSHLGSTLNFVYKRDVATPELAIQLKPLLVQFARQRTVEEDFGAFCQRVGSAGLAR